MSLATGAVYVAEAGFLLERAQVQLPPRLGSVACTLSIPSAAATHI